MRSVIGLTLLLLLGCIGTVEPPRFSDAPSATYHTTITTTITGEQTEAHLTTRSTRSYDAHRMLILETHTQSIGNATRIDERGWYRDADRALILENATWIEYAPTTGYDEALFILREPLIILERHLEHGYVSNEPINSSASYTITEAHRLFNASIGTGTPTVDIRTAIVTFEDDTPSTVSIEAIATSQDGSSRAHIAIERAFVDIGTTQVEEPSPDVTGSAPSGSSHRSRP